MQTRWQFVAAVVAVFFLADLAHADHKLFGQNRWQGSYSFSFGVSPGYFGGYRSFYLSPGYPAFYPGVVPPPYGYDSYYYGASSPYGIYYNPRANYADYYLPPLYAPAELNYGPQAMKQFMGLDRNLGLEPFQPRPAPVVVDKPAPARPVVRESNLEARRRAGHFMTLGDSLFREQRHHDALQQYKKASEIAPDLTEAYFRQGHALVATTRYELAAAAFKRGAAIDPDWTRAGFQLDDLYADTRVAKTSHLETLAAAALAAPNDADLMFVLGVFLYFDGQPERSQKFFQRSAALSADVAHLQHFLPKLEPIGDAAAKAGDGIDL
jgi:tetratricopeptide (TPR) repeat protein